MLDRALFISEIFWVFITSEDRRQGSVKICRFSSHPCGKGNWKRLAPLRETTFHPWGVSSPSCKGSPQPLALKLTSSAGWYLCVPFKDEGPDSWNSQPIFFLPMFPRFKCKGCCPPPRRLDTSSSPSHRRLNTSDILFMKPLGYFISLTSLVSTKKAWVVLKDGRKLSSVWLDWV